MSDPSSDDSREYVVEIEYTEDGLQIPFLMEDWMEMVKEDFASFDAIQNIWRRSPEETEEFLDEFLTEVDEEKDDDAIEPDCPTIRFKNPPQQWIDEPSSAMPIIRALDMMRARMGLWVISEEEYEAEEDLLDKNRFKEAIVRQSAFMEDYLTLQCQLEFQDLKDDFLNNNEVKMIEKMGHTPRVRLARLLGIVDKKEHDLLLDLAKKRNKIGHNSWTDFDEEDEAIFEQIATRVHSMEKKWLDEAEEAAAQRRESADDFSNETESRSIEVELLLIAVLNALQALDTPAAPDEIATITNYSEDGIRDACDQLIEEGMVREEDDMYRITPAGKERLEELS